MAKPMRDYLDEKFQEKWAEMVRENASLLTAIFVVPSEEKQPPSPKRIEKLLLKLRNFLFGGR